MSSPNVIEADLVVLNDGLVASGQAFSLSSDGPNIIRAWRVEISGPAKAAGQDVTIVANQLEFSGTDGSIDTSGKNGTNTWQPGTKPLPSNEPGTKGLTGADGGNGDNAGNVTIFAGVITGKVQVKAVGGAGSIGQDGGDGSTGAVGPSIPDGFGMHPPTGKPGGQGGQGGTAGKPGKSGNGGNLDIWVPSTANAPVIDARLTGGAAPLTAASGQPGGGGPGGAGGFVRYQYNQGKQIVLMRAGPGPQGPTGPIGPPADPQAVVPTGGAVGLLNGHSASAVPTSPCHALGNDDLSEHCSVQQLWSILTQAETYYLNEDFGNASSRLIWVATMSQLKGQKAAAPAHA